MRAFPATARDNDRGIMRLELDGDDIELLEAVVERLEALEKIEEALDVVASRSPFILGSDTPTATAEGTTLLRGILGGWGYPDDATVEMVET